MKTLTTLIAAALLTACAVTPLPTVPASEPHGIIFTQAHHAADDTYPVVVTNINGVNTPVIERAFVDQRYADEERNTFMLPPGKHAITLMADITDPRHPFARYERSPYRRFQLLELEVEEGKRYTLSARHIGPRLNDWEPVVTVADR